jgi:hypothetical protein
MPPYRPSGPMGRRDEVIDPVSPGFMAKRAHAHTAEINSSDASHAAKVANLVVRAAPRIR